MTEQGNDPVAQIYEAQDHLDAAVSHYDDGEFDEAAEKLEAAKDAIQVAITNINEE